MLPRDSRGRVDVGPLIAFGALALALAVARVALG